MEATAFDPQVVLSIRGDPRDFSVARKLFPRAKIRMKGWIRFLGRKSALVNLPYALGLLAVQNRYRSWAELSGVPYSEIEQKYSRMQSLAPRNGRVVIHLGAQWRSKQFPDVPGLRDHLRKSGREVILVAAPNDLLPARSTETEVTRAADQELIRLLRSAEHVITNDSGPMHLAAFLGCRTITVVRTSPIEEWLPPATRIVRSPITPRGYRPHPRYMTDEALPGWPSVSEIAAAIQSPESDRGDIQDSGGQQTCDVAGSIG